ncbi:MAG: hypothetical protein LBH47_00845 [Christensenellaceae bacterium]|nr:hypothetical protein [Christensenellaceae bacterium]
MYILQTDIYNIVKNLRHRGVSNEGVGSGLLDVLMYVFIAIGALVGVYAAYLVVLPRPRTVTFNVVVNGGRPIGG